jgi:hypothetical protein
VSAFPADDPGAGQPLDRRHEHDIGRSNLAQLIVGRVVLKDFLDPFLRPPAPPIRLDAVQD